MDVDFGKNVPKDNVFNRLAETLVLKDRLMLKPILLEAYEQTYGICDHDDPDNPLSIIGYHPTEDVEYDERLELLAKRYVTHDIRNLFDLSFADILNQPRYVNEKIFKIAAVIATERLAELENAGRDNVN
jgi:hypothetical protein